MKNCYLIAFALGLIRLFAPCDVLAVETTIYVGKHFEVRDHEQPTKYVFNGGTRVARVTSSLSTNTRVQRFRLHAGWNLLSLAVSVTNVSDLVQGSGMLTSARIWNPQTGDYSTVPQVAPAGTILWVNATTNTTLAITGAYQDPVNRQIAAGAGYLPSAGLEAWTPSIPSSVAAWSFSPKSSTLDSQPTWLARLTGDLSTVNELPSVFPPGQALYVISPAPFELEIPDPALRIRYYHQDHLGSSAVISDANGALVEETAFYPFGMPRHDHRVRSIEEPYQFTQKERDRESGLHYFEARYLVGGMSRFLSVDPKYANTDASAGDPQAMNLYAYVHNNPLKYSDPTGLDKYSEIANAAALSDTRTAAGSDDAGFAKNVLGGMFGGVLFGGGLLDDASTSAGFGDAILDSMAPSPLIYQGVFGGTSVGPDVRGALGINNVDMGSDRYDRGNTLGTVFSAASGGEGAANAIKAGITAARAARAARAVEQETAKLMKGRISAIAEMAPNVNKEMDDFLKSLKGDGLTSTDNWVQLGDIAGHPVPIPPKSFIELQDAFFEVGRVTGMSDEALTKATGFSPYR